MTTRPPCAVCGGPIPPELLSDRDIEAEADYCRSRHERMRDFYCGMTCFRIARDSRTGAEGRKARGAKAARTRLSRRDVSLSADNPPVETEAAH